LRRGFLGTPDGQIHYCAEGSGESLLLLHSTARSVDEFAEMIPILSKKMKVVAMDHIGCGDSYKPKTQPSIQDYARAVLNLLDGLNIEKVSIMGHLFGSYVGVELAATCPDRVSNLMLSGLSWIDKITGPKMQAGFKQWTIQPNGSHYVDIWNFFNTRAPRPIPILYRNVLDVLKAGEISEYGRVAVARYMNFESRLRLVRCPTLLIWGKKILELQGERGASDFTKRVAAAIPDCTEILVEGGSMYLPQQMPSTVAQIIDNFLEKSS